MMALHLALCLSFLSLLAAPATAQDQAAAAELARRETAAKSDPAALYAAAEWARANGLLTDWRRLLTKTLAADPQHAGAHGALGHVRYEGQWMSPAKAEILRNRAAGRVLVDGVWVPEAEAEDARSGVFRVDGRTVGKADYIALQAGGVRHPRTGELVAAADAEKAANGLFPDGDGGWVDEARANEIHGRTASPWVLRTEHCVLVGTLKLTELEQFTAYAEEAYAMARQLFGAEPAPDARPVVMIAGSPDQFRSFGDQIGGAASAYGGFLAEQGTTVRGLGSVVPGVALADANWGAYYVKHAVAASFAHGLGRGRLPAWMVSGCGGYAERFSSPELANWFGKQFLAAGGPTEPGSWFEGFGIDGSMDSPAIGRVLYQAGLLLAYSRHAGDAAAAAALDAIGQAATANDADAVRSACGSFASLLGDRGDRIRSYLQSLTR